MPSYPKEENLQCSCYACSCWAFHCQTALKTQVLELYQGDNQRAGRRTDKAFLFLLCFFIFFFSLPSKFESWTGGKSPGEKKQWLKFDVKFLKTATSGHTALKKNHSIWIKPPEAPSCVVRSVWSQAGEGDVAWSEEQSGAVWTGGKGKAVWRGMVSPCYAISNALCKFSEIVKGRHMYHLFKKWSATWDEGRSWDPKSTQSKCCLPQMNPGGRINWSLAVAWFLKEGRLM